MKFKQLILAASLSVLAVSCFNDDDLWNKIDENDQRIAALQTWQTQTNTNIASLRELLEAADYITDVQPITESDVTVGYTISFAKSDAINIYNGSAGVDAPIVSVQQAQDGSYFWTLNGEPMLDAEGNPLRASGPQGEQGDQGTPAATPQLKTGQSLTDAAVEGTWDAETLYLSVDGAKTWTPVSGKKGSKGEIVFKGVDATTNEDYVVFSLLGDVELLVPKYKEVNLSFKLNGNPVLNPGDLLLLTDGDILTYELAGSSVTEANKAGFRTVVTSDNPLWKITTDRTTGQVTINTAGLQGCTLTIVVTDNRGLERTYLLALCKKDFQWYANPVAKNVYAVATEADLFALARITNGTNLPAGASKDNFAGKTIKLGADVEMSGTEEWMPINNFAGTFDGQNHGIKGTLKYPDVKGNKGFFGTVSGVIENLKMEAALLNVDKGNVGGIAFELNGKGVIRNCVNSSDLIGSNNAAGIVYQISNGVGAIEACVNLGKIEPTSQAGGIVNSITGSGDLKVIGCINKGALKGKEGTAGIVMHIQACLLSACWSSAPSMESDAASAGIAVDNRGEISHCYWKALDNVTDGISFDSGTVEYCESFDADLPTAAQIADMDAAWAAANPDRAFRFNATTGEVEPMPAN